MLLGELSPFWVPPQTPQKLANAIELALQSDIDLTNAAILNKINADDVARALADII